jgi:hypothetical protein
MSSRNSFHSPGQTIACVHSPHCVLDAPTQEVGMRLAAMWPRPPAPCPLSASTRSGSCSHAWPRATRCWAGVPTATAPPPPLMRRQAAGVGATAKALGHQGAAGSSRAPPPPALLSSIGSCCVGRCALRTAPSHGWMPAAGGAPPPTPSQGTELCTWGAAMGRSQSSCSARGCRWGDVFVLADVRMRSTCFCVHVCVHGVWARVL